MVARVAAAAGAGDGAAGGSGFNSEGNEDADVPRSVGARWRDAGDPRFNALLVGLWGSAVYPFVPFDSERDGLRVRWGKFAFTGDAEPYPLR